MSKQPHYFIAVILPSEVKEKINEAKEEWQRSFPFKKWVHPSDYHLTLAFLGSSSMEQLQTLINLTNKQIQSKQAFYLQIHKLGIFGNPNKPKIFWLGVNESKPLHMLRNDVYDVCKSAGYILESRAFHPHITLARKWSEGDFPKQLLDEEALSLEKELLFEVKSIQLFQTHLDKVPKYEAIHTFNF
ncbi:RNA 2',3'-cyclic phosphodiesterase [Niallia sp. 01092]|uniref:RNA 2',3'-cyclic phosphodiesterase n=1 Tax=unclassified Niallia TaxID=2837522 RepID=UPI003FD26EB2